jgi:hypothetical protein
MLFILTISVQKGYKENWSARAEAHEIQNQL